MVPAVLAGAADEVAQLELLVAGGQVARRGALGLDDVERRVRHCGGKRESVSKPLVVQELRAKCKAAWAMGGAALTARRKLTMVVVARGAYDAFGHGRNRVGSLR